MAVFSPPPQRDEEFATWAQNLSAILTVSYAAYGLLVGDSTALATLYSAYSSALSTSKNPTTRTPASIMLKDTAKAQLMADCRALAKRIQANVNVTPAQKVSVGVTVPDHVRTPVPPPATKPQVTVTGMESLAFDLRLADELTPTRRARPAGVGGAEIYTFIAAAGVTPPQDMTAWSYQGRAQRPTWRLTFNQADAGKIVHIKAAWVSTRGAVGPVSDDLARSIAA